MCACRGVRVFMNPIVLMLLLNSVIWLIIYKITDHDVFKIWKIHVLLLRVDGFCDPHISLPMAGFKFPKFRVGLLLGPDGLHLP